MSTQATAKQEKQQETVYSYDAVHEARRLTEPLRKDATDAELLQAVASFFSRFAELPKGAPLVLALYAVMTHCFNCFDALPYLLITSPTKGCGKTRILELLRGFSAQAHFTVGISAAALFRAVHAKRPTLLIDESEKLSGKLSDSAKAILEIANAGYKQGQTVMRCEGNSDNQFKTVEFQVYCPKVFALIDSGRAFPPTLRDRSIEIRMVRSNRCLPRYRLNRVQEAAKPYHEKLAAWANRNQPLIKEWYASHDLDFLQGRAEEIWLPLFAVCAVICPARQNELKRIARSHTFQDAADEGDPSLRLLADVRAVWHEERISSAELCERLKAHEEMPYRHWNTGTGISQSDLAKRLAPFGIRPKQLRFGEDNRNGYERSAFEPVWTQYGSPAGQCKLPVMALTELGAAS